DQWPLVKERVAILQQLVQEQLNAGHIKESTSPWNTPVFVIHKKSGKWRLLLDLCWINDVLEDMGPVQRGLPSPTVIPNRWKILIIDLKDCFFTVTIHPEDSEKFAFSVPVVNKEGPMKCYQWAVLPQGLKNSPTMCQLFVDKALRPFREKHKELLVYHYMGDVLIACQDLEGIKPELCQTLGESKLQVTPEKVQEKTPWQYLGWKILNQSIIPQKVTIRVEVQTLNNVQKLVGNIHWIRNFLGIDNQTLQPLFALLRGD
ncbi:hypothetical protein N303_09553, partial [Cuculus canorus]